MKAYDIIQLHNATTIRDSSKMKDFIKCERYYFFRHILGWEPEVPSNHLSFGRAWHEAMEQLLLHGYSAESIFEAHRKLVECYRQDFGPETDEMYAPKTPDIALIMLIEYCKRYIRDNFITHHTEIGGKVMMDDRRHLHFRMDSICEGSDAKIFSLEHKTGSSLWGWEHQWPLAIQAGVYSHVLYCLYPFERVGGIIINGAFFMKSKKGWDQMLNGEKLTVKEPYDFLRYPVRKTPSQMNAWHSNLIHYMNMLDWEMERLGECSDSDSTMEAFHCRADNCNHFGRLCEFHDFCSSWANPLQRADVIPIGFQQRFWDPTEEPVKTEIEVNQGGEVSVKENLSTTPEEG